MKRIIIWMNTIVLLLIISAVFTYQTLAQGTGKVEEKTSEIRQKENIVFLGDSILDWYPTDEIYDDFPIVNSGIVGNKTTSILEDMENRVYKYNPTKVFILVGTNDIEWEDSEELNQEVFNNLKEIANKIRQNRSKCDIYMMSILPVNNHLSGANDRHISEIKEINSMVEKFCETDEKITFINLFDEFKGEEEMLKTSYTNDGLHLNDLGYAKLTKILMKYIYE